MSARGSGPFLALGGALLLGYGAAGVWVETTLSRDVGGVAVTGVEVRTGTEYAGAALPVALLVAVIAGLAFLGRGPARRVLAGLLAVAAVAGLWAVAAGLPAAMAETGTLSAAPWVALAGVCCVLVGAAFTGRAPRPAPLLDERYTVEAGEPEDEEWRLAAGEPDQADGPDGGV